jgi:hypothetical protein
MPDHAQELRIDLNPVDITVSLTGFPPDAEVQRLGFPVLLERIGAESPAKLMASLWQAASDDAIGVDTTINIHHVMHAPFHAYVGSFLAPSKDQFAPECCRAIVFRGVPPGEYTLKLYRTFDDFSSRSDKPFHVQRLVVGDQIEDLEIAVPYPGG